MGSSSILGYSTAPFAESTTTTKMRISKQEAQPSLTTGPGLPTPPNSPLYRTHEAGRKSEEPKFSPEPGSLRSQLNFDPWICGSRTKTTKEPCTLRTKAERRVDALIKLESLQLLTQSSYSLETELRHLAKMVHCRHHNHDPYLHERVEKWKAVFPLGDNKINPDASIRMAVKELFSKLSDCCAGVKLDNKPCFRRIGGRKVQNRSKTIEEIVKPEIYGNICKLEYFLEVLAENMYCHLHKNQGPKQVEVWKLATTKFCNEKGSGLSLMTDDKDGKNQDLAKADLDFSTVAYHSAVDSDLSEFNTPIPWNLRYPSPAEFWPETYDTTPFNILTRANHLEDQELLFLGVQKQLQAPLRKEDRGEGFLYAYEVEGNKGFVKIGYTTRSINERHDEWSFHCNRLTKPIYPPIFNVNTVVPNAARVEKLCHAELKHRNTRIYCSGCLKLHIEWFEASPSEAIAVIEKWSKWMRSHPYQPNPIDSSNTWTLRPEEEQKSKDIGRFMKGIAQ
ncbi:T5orf172 domain-containing protein [Aspergillus pseudotamarii]|uniref:T5orf172 domain-containing protein n=1 Tax=Aspergillus pseudotamarii TaxID=132259 RepID=A0A5N6SJK3_ASPPS|nr:T5orf172 domain-containing protein [Aspergillus pseudotamarii]KAE8133563.1 T5orf172 domain-containing protein [Aspergillus pseudotamarii]